MQGAIAPRLVRLLCRIGARAGGRLAVLPDGGFRSPAQNAYNRSLSPEVAVNSYHLRGMAADIIVPGLSPAGAARLARSLGAGGVGTYPQFTHVDVGPRRDWSGAGTGPEDPQPGDAGAPAAADRIVIVKSQRTLTLLRGGAELKTYRIALGRAPAGPKTQAGDGRTPEGRYIIAGRNGASRFHRAFRLSYPNSADRARARAAGVSPGGSIMIHGLPNGYDDESASAVASDWTDGCIALTDRDMDELWRLVPVGTPVDILP